MVLFFRLMRAIDGLQNVCAFTTENVSSLLVPSHLSRPVSIAACRDAAKRARIGTASRAVRAARVSPKPRWVRPLASGVHTRTHTHTHTNGSFT